MESWDIAGWVQGTFGWAGKVSGHMPGRGNHGCSRETSCWTGLELPEMAPLTPGVCHVWAASIRNEDSLGWWWGPLV